MDRLTEFEKQFAKNRKDWTKAQWKSVAMTLSGVPTLVAPRGRPKQLCSGEQKPALSASANYQALASQVSQRMKQTGNTKIKETVREIMTESLKSNRDEVKGYDKRESLVEKHLNTAYTAVRKLLRQWADK
jgi:hypothetical protein